MHVPILFWDNSTPWVSREQKCSQHWHWIIIFLLLHTGNWLVKKVLKATCLMPGCWDVVFAFHTSDLISQLPANESGVSFPLSYLSLPRFWLLTARCVVCLLSNGEAQLKFIPHVNISECRWLFLKWKHSIIVMRATYKYLKHEHLAVLRSLTHFYVQMYLKNEKQKLYCSIKLLSDSCSRSNKVLFFLSQISIR